MSDRWTIGIDADTRQIAYAVSRNGAISAVHTIPRARGACRVDEAYDRRLGELMRKAAACKARVLVEGIYLAEQRGKAVRRNVRGYAALAKVHGEIELEARRAGVEVETVAPTTWQSRILGITKGREDIKAASASYASAATGKKLTEHESDAVCICRCGDGRSQS